MTPLVGAHLSQCHLYQKQSEKKSTEKLSQEKDSTAKNQTKEDNKTSLLCCLGGWVASFVVQAQRFEDW